VHTEATNVTIYAECSRLFGTLASSKFVSGQVMEIVPGVQRNGRRKTDLRVMWTVKTRLVDKTLSLRSVKAGSPPALAPTPPPTGIEVASPVTQGSQDATVPQDGGHPPLAPPNRFSMTGLPPPSSQVTPSPSIGAHAGDPASHASAATLTTTTAHGLTWTAGAVEQPVGGPVARRSWSVRT